MDQTTIQKIESRVILNSKGQKTIETDVYTQKGFGRASAPIGTSAGKHEVTQLPEKPEKLIKKAKQKLYPQIVGINSLKQEEIDEEIKKIDGTPTLKNYGAAVTLPLSIATAKAAADTQNIPLHHHLNKVKNYHLPRHIGKCISGGLHSHKGPEIQEFLSIPLKTDSFKESCLLNLKMYEEVKKSLEKEDKCFTGGRGLELGYTTTLNNEECLRIMNIAKERVEEATGKTIEIGIDAAASEIYRKGKYHYEEKKRDPEEQFSHIIQIIEDHDLTYIEDPFEEEDFQNHAKLTKKQKNKIICGDDIFTTNLKRFEKGIKEKACNTILIKPNQVGTITDTKKTIKRAKQERYHTTISHRSAETNDTFISHLAIAHQTPMMKIGITGGERVAKLNELIRIENYLKGE